jgi:hypothetical protein
MFRGVLGSCAEIRSLGLTPRSLALARVSVFVAYSRGTTSRAEERPLRRVPVPFGARGGSYILKDVPGGLTARA